MKTINFKIAAIACILVLGLTNCKNTPTDKAADVESAQEELKDAEYELQEALIDSTNEYTRYKIESEAKLKENDMKIIALNEKLKTEKMEIRTKYEKDLLALELKNEKLKENLKDYQETDKNKWEKFKTSFNDELNEIGKSIVRITEKK